MEERKMPGFLKLNKGKLIWAGLFSVAVTVGKNIHYEGISRGMDDNYVEKLGMVDAAIFLGVFAAAFGFIYAISLAIAKYQPRERKRSLPLPLVFGIAFVVMLAAWLPYILAYAPGVILTDTNSSIGQIVWEGHPTSSHFPVFYTLYLGFFVKLGLFLQNMNAGIMAYSILQVLICAGTFSYVIAVLYSRKLPMWMLLLFEAFYAFCPLFPIYAMNVQKDIIFSCALVWMSLIHCENWGGWRYYIWTSISALCVMLFRNNGIYIVLVFGAIITLQTRKLTKAVPLLAAAFVFLAFSLITTKAWDIRGDYKENMGIPMQQLASVIAGGDKLPAEDEELLYRILPKEKWVSEYAPCLNDNIKWAQGFDSDVFDANKAGFLRAWAHGLVKYPGKYVKAYIMETFGFWKPFVGDDYGYCVTAMSDGGFGISRMYADTELPGRRLVSLNIQNILRLDAGTLLWIMLLCMTVAAGRSKKLTLVYAPSLLNFATIMLAAPVAFCLRYVFVFVMGLPLYIGIMFWAPKAPSSVSSR